MNQINGFSGEYRWLSNFWPAETVLEGWQFPSSEHAYQACKSLDPNEWQVIQTLTAGQSKRYGRNIQLRPDWEDVKIDAMRTCLKAKFQNHELRTKLVMTGTAELIEQNTWNDTFWGVAFGRGQNHLGKLLMELRDTLIKEHQA